MRILSADDDPVTRLTLAAALSKEGHEVVEVEDGEAAWELLQQPDAPKLVLLDWMMPKMDGLEVLRKVRSNAHAQPIYVILLTCRTTKEDIVRGLEAGADDYLCKPFDLGELRARVQVGARIVQLQGILSRRVFELQSALTARQRVEEELMKEQYYLHSLMNYLPDAIYFKDASSRFVRISREQARRLGLAHPSEAVGKTDHDFFAEEHASRAFEDEQQIMRTREPVVAKEEKETWPDGSVTWVTSTKVPLLEPDGQIAGTFGVSRDITERKRAEAERLLLTTAVEQAADAILITDAEGRIQYVNPAFTRMTGYTGDEAIGQNPRLLKSGKQDPECYRDLWKTILSGGTWRGELVNRRKDGTLYTETMTIAPVRDSSGAITNFIAVKQDISERKRAEERLRLMEFSLENASDAVYWMNSEGLIVYANEAACRSLGRSREELLSLSIPDIDPLVSKEVWPAIWEQLKAHGSMTFETEHRTAQGTVFPVEVTANYLKFDGNEYSFAFARDITERKQAEEALRASEGRFRLLFETNVALIIRATINGRIVDCNGPAARALGYESPQEMLGLSMRDIHWDPEKRVELMARLQAEKTVAGVEVKLRHKDGRPIWLIVNLSLTPADDTGETLVQGTLVDITERKRAEEALAGERNLLRALIDNTPDFVFVKDLQSRFVVANNAVARAFGLEKPDQLIGKTDFDFAPPSLAERYVADDKALMESGEALISREEPSPDATGDLRWLSTTKVPLRNSEGKVIGLVAVCRDITERKRAEEATRFLASIVETSNEAIIGKALDGTILSWNKGAELIYGYPAEEVIGKPIRILCPPGRADEVPQMLARIKLGEKISHYETVRIRRDGSRIEVSLAISPIKNTAGEVTGAATIARDISERKRAEEAEAEARKMELQYRGLFEHMCEGLAYCRMVFENGQARDFIYLAVNKAFGTLTGLKDVTGKRVSEVIPGIRETNPGLFETYARVALTGTPENFEVFVEALGMWFSISVYSPEKEFFVAIFDVISERKRTEEVLAEGAKLADLRAEVGVALTRGGTLRTGLQECAEALVGHAGAAFARIWTLNEAAAILVLEASAGIYTHLNGPHGRVPVGCFKIGRIAESRTPHLSNDVQNDPEVGDHAWAKREGLVSFVGHPLLVENKLVGVVAAFGPRSFSEATLLAFASVANQIAQFVHGKRAEEALQRSEAYLAESQRLSHVGSWAWNVASKEIVYWSPEHYRIFGFDAGKEPVSFAAALERVHPEDRRRVGKVVAKIVGEQTDFEWDFRLLLPDGSIKYIHGTGHPVANERGEMTELVGTHVDVTERKRAEARLTAQYEVARALTESGTLAEAAPRILQAVCEPLGWDHGTFWEVDKKANLLRWVGGWHAPSFDLTGLEAFQRRVALAPGAGLAGSVWISGQPSWIPDISPSEGDNKIAVEYGLRAAVTFPVVAGAEVVGVMQLFSRQVVQPDRQVLQMLVTIGGQIGPLIERQRAQDEAGRAQEALQRSEERARLLFATIPHPAYVVDLGTLQFLEVNDAAVERYGYSREEFLRMTVAQIRLPEEQESLKEYARQIRAHYQGTGEWKHRTKDGHTLDVEASIHTFGYDGRRAAVVIAQDVTARKQLELELRHSQKLEAVGGLASGIAHELNTPIQFVGDNTHFLQDAFRDLAQVLERYHHLRDAAASGAVPPALLDEVARAEAAADLDYLRQEIPKALEQSLDGVTRVARIVRAMKEFAHPDRSEKMATDLNKSLESTLIVARNEIKYVADMETDFGELPPVLCHGGDLNQVFLNLLVNAAHAIKDVVKDNGKKGIIRIRTRQEGDEVLISIGDTGSGIPGNIRDKIFQPFFTTKEVGRGTGQGLAIARTIVVDKHGGTLTFDTEVGRGTTFHIRLPVDPGNRE